MSSLKLWFNNDTRRILVDLENLSYSKLVEVTKSIYNLPSDLLSISYRWVDEEGDTVTLSSQMELDIALFVMIKCQGRLAKFQVIIDKKISEDKKESDGNQAVHPRITCDGCRSYPLTGIRYKCTVRNDFDLCENCESKSVQPYPMIKIYKPEQRPAAIFVAVNEDESNRSGTNNDDGGRGEERMKGDRHGGRWGKRCSRGAQERRSAGGRGDRAQAFEENMKRFVQEVVPLAEGVFGQSFVELAQKISQGVPESHPLLQIVRMFVDPSQPQDIKGEDKTPDAAGDKSEPMSPEERQMVEAALRDSEVQSSAATAAPTASTSSYGSVSSPSLVIVSADGEVVEEEEEREEVSVGSDEVKENEPSAKPSIEPSPPITAPNTSARSSGETTVRSNSSSENEILKWSEEISLLEDMGFDDVEVILPLLRKFCGPRTAGWNVFGPSRTERDPAALQRVVNMLLATKR